MAPKGDTLQTKINGLRTFPEMLANELKEATTMRPVTNVEIQLPALNENTKAKAGVLVKRIVDGLQKAGLEAIADQFRDDAPKYPEDVLKVIRVGCKYVQFIPHKSGISIDLVHKDVSEIMQMVARGEISPQDAADHIEKLEHAEKPIAEPVATGHCHY